MTRDISPSVLPLLLLLSAATACAGPVESLWPPSADDPTRTIIISVDAWHAVIALPLSEQPSALSSQLSAPTSQVPSPGDQPSTMSHPLFEEWGYAEQGWYLEDRRGLSGVFRALLWPTAGVVEVARSAHVWAERTPDPPAETFRFAITEDGYQRLRRHLESTIARRDPLLARGVSTFFPAVRSYHFFHQCHQYAARALREAGLPVSPGWALTRGLFAAQLARAERLERAEPRARLEDPPSGTSLARADQRVVTD